jgi:uncharacterized protein DUF4190
MTTAPGSSDRPDAHGDEPAADAPFDPYRFGKPEHPVPPEYAPYGTPYPGPYGPPPGNVAPGPTSYGAPPPPNWNAYPAPQAGNGKAVASLVLGIVSIVMCWLTLFNAVFIVLALIFGVLALNDSRSRNGAGRGMAVAGLVCCAVGTAATVLVTVWFLHAVDKCGGIDNRTSSSFQQCVQDHL